MGLRRRPRLHLVGQRITRRRARFGLVFPPSGLTDKTAPIGGVRYASWLRRAAALLLDGLLISIIGYLLGGLLQFAPSVVTAALWPLFLTVVLFGGIGLVYSTLCLDRLHGQSPGMSMLRIRCMPMEGHGRISFAQAAVRSVTFWVLWGGLLYVADGHLRWWSWGAGIALAVLALAPLVQHRRQSLWDYLANTAIFDER